MKDTTSNGKILPQNTEKVKTDSEKIQEAAQVENIVNATAREAMREYITSGNTDIFGKHLQTLATIIAQCKLTKLYNDDKKGREEFRTFKAQIYNYRSQQTARDNINDLYIWDTNADSYTCTDCKTETDIMKDMKNRKDTVGADIVQEAIISLLEIIRTAEKNGTLSESTLLDTFTTYDLRSIYYSDGTKKPSEKWKEKASNGVKEASRSISRYIERERSVREQATLYNEIVTHCFDENRQEVGTFSTYKKASSLSAVDMVDYNGRLSATVADTDTDSLFKSIPEKCAFTQKERYVYFHHYDKQESFDQIADKLNISVSAVKTYDSRLKSKIVKANIFTQFTADDKGGIVKAEKAIRCFSADDETKTTITTFDSVSNASRILGIDKSLISKVLKGKRQTAGGLKFEYIDK